MLRDPVQDHARDATEETVSASSGTVDGATRNGHRAALSEPALLRHYAATRDPEVKEELVHRFLPLARSLALRYRGVPEPLDDLIQVASLGLVKALNGFDPERGTSFKAYAAPTILGELRRHFRDRVWELRLPRDLQERTMVVREAAVALADELGRTPTVPRIAQYLELSEEEVFEAVEADAARQTLSLDAPHGHEDSDPTPMVEAVGGRDPGYGRVEDQLAADGVTLTSRERTVLRLRFEDDLTQREIGKCLGISQMQVSRVMRGGLRRVLEAVAVES
jgi:RNA polymerase sigma-B factor